MKTFWKKTGQAALTLLPVIISLAAQLLIGFAIILIPAIIAGILSARGSASAVHMQQFIIEHSSDLASIATCLYHILALFGFGLWYYLGCGRPKPVSPVTVFKEKCLPVTIGIGLFMCLGADALLCAAEYIVPELIQSYSDLMEAVGLGIDPLIIITSVLIAPVGEEILCRGVTFHYARKLTEGMKNPKTAFWIANILQALMFGIMHGNLVQGTYAFLMGLCLGWLRNRYRSLYPAMLAHFVVNFSSTFFLDSLITLVPQFFILYVLIMAVCIGAIIALMRLDHKASDS